MREVEVALPYESYPIYGGAVGADTIRPRAADCRPYNAYPALVRVL